MFCFNKKLTLLLLSLVLVDSFNVVFLAKRARGGLKRSLDGGEEKVNPKAANRGKGQEITGVTLPAEGKVRGWEFGEGARMACANIDGKYYALEGQCPRCAFDLWKGNVINNDPGFDDLPRLACPTCATTFSLRTGKSGPPLKRTGIQAFVGKLAKTATASDSSKNAKAFQITRDDDGRVFCRET
mmetsp:Transcript_8474/g.11164  ORF Transcript_8474/g.11164 Transcript_8474/m.11164 type:complete len:185 (-) Transcript_8474:1613-2167(-)